MMNYRVFLMMVITVLPTGVMAGNSVIPNPDSDTNVMPAKPGTSRSPCIVNGMVLQDCAPRNWQRQESAPQDSRPQQRIAPQNKNGSRLVPLNN